MKAKLIAKNPNKEYRCSGCGVVGTWNLGNHGVLASTDAMRAGWMGLKLQS
jgi:hypothetical protein